jgi:hypothetical protein
MCRNPHTRSAVQLLIAFAAIVRVLQGHFQLWEIPLQCIRREVHFSLSRWTSILLNAA